MLENWWFVHSSETTLSRKAVLYMSQDAIYIWEPLCLQISTVVQCLKTKMKDKEKLIIYWDITTGHPESRKWYEQEISWDK